MKTPEEIKQRRKEYDARNKEKIRKQKSDWRKSNREIVLEHKRKSYERNKESHASYMKNYYYMKRHTDPNFKLLCNLRRRLTNALKSNKKTLRTIDLLGCSIVELRNHIEKQFKEGMTWENNIHKGWHIDHIIPCSSFDLSDIEQQKKCFHYTNLQPLWWHENLAKRFIVNKIGIEGFEPTHHKDIRS